MRRELTILQINDVHAYLDMHPELFFGPKGPEYRQAGGYARITSLVKGMRTERPQGSLLLDNGDTLHGTYPAVNTQGRALTPILNSLGLDAMTVHWDAVYGPEILEARAEELNYPILASNLRHENNGEQPFPSYRVLEKAGLRIGLIGLASNLIKPPFSPGFTSDLELERLPGYIENLRSHEKVDLVVVLSHLGFPQDLQLATDVSGIDVLVSGHTHNRTYQPARQGNTLVIQSGSHGSFLGRLDVVLEDGQLTDYKHNLLVVEQKIEPDPEVHSLVQSALTPFRQELSEVVGETIQPLDRVGMLETTLDNLLLLALKESSGTELAFSNGWRYGAPILPGKITVNDLYNIIPMNPPVMTIELTGEELTAMLEENMERTFSRDPYQQMGGYLKRALGLKAYIKAENPDGQRLQKLFVGEQPVHPEKVYQASFVTEQGVPMKYGRNRQKQAPQAVDALRSYVKRHTPLRVNLLGTFVVV
jgi:2',3'-cyclic-nucleotide 2'-phosphodiesterase (5'-nucleotidase family)